MDIYTFTVVIDGDAGTDENTDALFEAGCDDATFSHSSGISYGDFDREAESLNDAVLSGIEAVESVGGLRVRRVDSDDFVTVLDFPAAVSSMRGKGKVWDWSEVAAWAGVDYDPERAATIAAVNGAFALRSAKSPLDAKQLARLFHFAAA